MVVRRDRIIGRRFPGFSLQLSESKLLHGEKIIKKVQAPGEIFPAHAALYRRGTLLTVASIEGLTFHVSYPIPMQALGEGPRQSRRMDCRNR